MLCPKCRNEQDDRNLLCDYCGIVFAKYPAAHGEDATVAGEVVGGGAGSAAARITAALAAHDAEASFTVYESRAVRAARWARERLGLAPAIGHPAALAWRALLLLLLGVWGWRLATPPIESNAVGESFLHLVNLPFHEAGHVFFGPLGQFVRTLGGSLGQLLMPMVCCLVLLFKTRDPFGAGVALWWFGENLLDLTPYIDDAGTGELPLLGGNTGESTPYGFHDWEYLMTETHTLGREHDLARAVHVAGTVVMAFALAWMLVTLVRGWRRGRVKLRARAAAIAAAIAAAQERDAA